MAEREELRLGHREHVAHFRQVLIDTGRKELQTESIVDIALAARLMPVTDLASLAPQVFECATKGDVALKKIIKEGALKLAACAIGGVYKQLGVKESVPLGMAGSLIVKNTEYRKMILDAIQKKIALSNVHVVTDPAYEAALAALQRWS